MSTFCGGCGNQVPDGLRFCTNCGRPRAGVGGAGGEEQQTRASQVGPGGATSARPAPEQTYSMPADDPYLRRRGSKKPLVVIGGIAAVLIVVGVTVSVIEATVFGPKATVNAYFAALDDGDAEKALSLVDDAKSQPPDAENRPPTQMSDDLLDADVLSTDAYEPPANLDIKRLTSSGGGDTETRLVSLSYTVNGKRLVNELRVAKAGDKRFGLFERWIIEGGLSTMTLSSGAPSSVNGVTVTSLDIARFREPDNELLPGVVTTMFRALPGGYDVGVVRNPLMSGKGKAVTVPVGGEEVTVSLDLDIKEKAKTEARQQVIDHLDECAEQTTFEPKGCPFDTSFADAENSRNIRWSITKYPTVSVEWQDEVRAFVVLTDEGGDGMATVSYDYKSSWNPSAGYEPQTRPVSFGVEGPVLLENGKVKWSQPQTEGDDGD